MSDPRKLVKEIVQFMGEKSPEITIANNFNGGCERWLQMNLALAFVNGSVSRKSYEVNETIFTEEPYRINPNQRADLVISTDPEGTKTDNYLVLELKVTPHSAKVGSIVSDIVSIWNKENAELHDPQKKVVGGAFIAVIDASYFDLKTVKADIIEELKADPNFPLTAFKDEVQTSDLGNQLYAYYIVRPFVQSANRPTEHVSCTVSKTGLDQ